MEDEMKKIIVMLMVLIMALSLAACGANEVENNVANVEVTNENNNTKEENNEVTEEPAEEVEEEKVFEPITFVDGTDREVTINKEPLRVITMAPSMTEMVYALGLGDRLVGRTDYCNFPAEALEVESIGSLREPNIESIIALNPDLVLMSTHASEEVVAKFDEAGITVAVLTAQESFEGVYDIIGQMALIFDVQEAATALIEEMQAEVTEIMDLVKDVEKKTVYYVVGYGEYGDYTATGDTFIHNMLEMAGGSNIAADGEYWSYNLESLIEKDPQVIIVSELFDTKTAFAEMDGYKDLTAVVEGNLVEINQDLLSRQGPRLGQGLKAIAQLLHPELFE